MDLLHKPTCLYTGGGGGELSHVLIAVHKRLYIGDFDESSHQPFKASIITAIFQQRMWDLKNKVSCYGHTGNKVASI